VSQAPGPVVGLNPWLPWPLSGWRWWTEPVRAERLAVLRIGLAALLLIDILTSYLPHLHDFFGPDSLGTPAMFDYLARAPKWNWSLLRGFQDPLLLTAGQCAWLVTTPVILLGLWGRLSAAGRAGPHPVLRGALAVWTAATAVTVLGLWTKVSPASASGASLLWRIPMGILGVATLFWCLALWRRLRDEPDDDPGVWRGVLLAWLASAALAVLGLCKMAAAPDRLLFLDWAHVAWHGEVGPLRAAMVAWVVAVVLLLLGVCTRVSAAAAWALSLSFDNLNWYINNAGDQVRGLALFYLMLTPCGAAWSVDSWLARRGGRRPGPVYVYPWALRLLFVQMAVIYFCNGVYKVFGADWQKGESLYHVWCDLVLTRISYAQLPAPFWLTRLMSWTVLAWELTFPILVLLKWTRTPALLFGVAFHLGIFATLELGGFGPYMIALYLPLLPWDRWLGQRERRAPAKAGGAAPSDKVVALPDAQPVAAEGGTR
jgi:Vitamin K-dependent gamma-carboxylase